VEGSSPPVEPGPPEEIGRSARKRRAILDAATEAFLRKGYLGTSMDAIAAEAGVSKQTVYRQFADKEALFNEIVLGTIDQVGEPFFSGIEDLDGSEDLEAELRKTARQLVGVAGDARLLQLRRLVIGECGRFPELGHTYYERGPGRATQGLATGFRRLAEKGLLRIDDPDQAAQQFNWLVLATPLNLAMFSVDAEFTDAELQGYADDAVRVFLAAYGQPEG
jgi:TetR/AcrR family transcriptional regulator, mexJK operon transcriptional repressor